MFAVGQVFIRKVVAVWAFNVLIITTMARINLTPSPLSLLRRGVLISVISTSVCLLRRGVSLAFDWCYIS